jgi:hypothetical protein
MKPHYLSLILTLCLFGCSDSSLPTEATWSDPGEVLAKGATRSPVIIEDSFVDGPYYVSCLGEEAMFSISIRYEADVLTTPSGNEHWLGWLYEYSNEINGLSTGDHWVGSGIAHNSGHIKADGRYRDFEAIRETFVKDGTGEQLKLMWHWRVTPSNPWSLEIVSCTVLGPN